MSENSKNDWFGELEIIRQAHALRSEHIARWTKKLFGSLFAPMTAGLSRHVLEPIRRRHQFNRQYEQLMALDDRLYRDLGISRGDAAYVIRHGRENQTMAANNNAKTPTSNRHKASNTLKEMAKPQVA